MITDEIKEKTIQYLKKFWYGVTGVDRKLADKVGTLYEKQLDFKHEMIKGLKTDMDVKGIEDEVKKFGQDLTDTVKGSKK
jgi:hypothetical protein